MNNQITLRTSQGEYFPGDVVYGAVYLNICCPSEARGASVTFKGRELCVYECTIDGERTQLKNEKTHVDYNNITLYSQDECFPIGSYVFPFKFELPREIPGTFHCSGKKDLTEWKTDVSYSIRTHAVGAESLQASQQIVIYQADKEEFKLNAFGAANTEKCTLPGVIPFTSKSVHVTAKLLQNFTKTGSNMALRLIITNPSKFKVSRFKIQLIRYLKFMLRGEEAPLKGASNMEWDNGLVHIAPENGPHVIQTIQGESDVIFVGNGGLDKIQIPLSEKVAGGKMDIPASVIGKHVKNQYGLEVSLTFSNNQSQTVNLIIPGVVPKLNADWLSWTAPSWAYSCSVKLSACIFSVPESKLHTEALSNLPMFQVL